MLDTLSRVVKVERSTTEALNLRRIFGLTCGEIRGLHNSDFIEFADAAAARRALALNADGVRVLNVASQPCLIDQYRVVNPSAFNLDVSSISNTRSNTLVSTTGFNPTSDIEISAPSGLHCSPPSRHLLHSLKTCDSPISQSMTSPPAIVSSSSEHGASTRPIEMPGPSIQSRVISMRLCGETISLDLKTLTGEPASVIELLRMTSSDRGNWMTVGAYYRHIAHPEASRSVLSAMLEVFEQPDTSTHDLNPGNAAKADEHLKNAQNWLQRVYGTFSQSLLIGPSLGEKTEPVSIPTAPRSLSRSRNTSPGLPSRPTSDSRIFEREMQLLQERHAQDVAEIAGMRSLKRKLEDIVETERLVRRRLQRDLDNICKERDRARRLENSAIEQLAKEAEFRRRAEERVAEERQLREQVERSMEARFLRQSTHIPDLQSRT
ncbi:unnamed protein product [Mycena citricolor]|uniref:Uncharacterized protein n=1 Tax=Mycena citricolor TaxID=2018698 RepID=A0AAD2K6I1_9AGAR|nr:unnamed protein product [Mycena citricolor]